MDCEFNRQRKSFNFIWKLENFEFCGIKTGTPIDSPAFIVDTFERTKWSLRIYPRGVETEKWISLFIHRTGDSKGPSSIEIDYELAFLGKEDSILISKSNCNEKYLKHSGWGFPEFEDRETVITEPSIFLPQDILTVRCRMWKSVGEVKTDGRCVARTRISAERKGFIWEIQNFSLFGSGRETSFRLKSTTDDKPVVSLQLCLGKNQRLHDINIKFINSNVKIVFSKFKSTLVDSEGHHIDCGQYEFWFSNAVQIEECTLPLSKKALISNNCLYLPDDILTLHCEYAFSSDILSESIEETYYGCTGSCITYDGVPENMKADIKEKSYSDSFSDLKIDLGSMLQENIHCDVKLRTESETLTAHWFILSARSPVFRAMFKSNMKEKTMSRIDIEDLKPDTVRRMLLYMYTNYLEELQWKTASDLYVAADKYQILGLKDKCSNFLKTNLSLTNACAVLVLADLHQDKELKSAVQDFILENDKSIINSSEWKLFMGTNINLAAETMLLRFKE